MATYVVKPGGDDSAGTGSEANPFKTATKGGRMLQPGDTLLVEGKVSGQLVPGASGTAARPIAIRGLAGAELTQQINLANCQHVHVEKLKLTSHGSMWVNSNKASGHNWFVDVVLDSGPYKPPAAGSSGTGYPFVGMLLHGDYNRLINPTVGTWFGGDAVQSWGNYALVQGGDWSKCKSGHGPIMMFGDYGVMGGTPQRPIPITNPWGRACEMLGKYSTGKRNLIENIMVTDSNWNGSDAWQGHRADKDGQIAKTGGDGAIFRDISVRRSRPAPYPYACVFHLGNYGDPTKTLITVFKNMRFYDLIVEDNPQHAFAITRDPTMPFDCSNNRIFNSVLRRNNHSFWMQQEGPWLDSFYIEDSLVTDPIRRGGSAYTVEQYQSKWPHLAKRNSSSKQPPKAPLAVVTASSTSDVVTLDDSLPLSDGNTLVAGDIVMVGEKAVQVREWLDSKRVRLQERVTVQAGENVRRLKDYAAPAPAEPQPVIQPAVVAPEPPATEPPATEPPVAEPPAEVQVTQSKVALTVEGESVTLTIDGVVVFCSDGLPPPEAAVASE